MGGGGRILSALNFSQAGDAKRIKLGVSAMRWLVPTNTSEDPKFRKGAYYAYQEKNIIC